MALSPSKKNSVEEFETNFVAVPPASASSNRVATNSTMSQGQGRDRQVTDSDDDGQIGTGNPIYQQIEIEARAELLDLRSQVKKEMIKVRQEIKTEPLKYSKKFLDTKLCDLLKLTGQPSSFEDLIARCGALSLGKKIDPNQTGSSQGSVPPVIDFKPPKVPRKFATPKVFKFNTNFTSPGSSASSHSQASIFSFGESDKAPRTIKPGEILYSKNFSPIMIQNEVPGSSANNMKTPPRKERLKVIDGKNEIEVDVVLAKSKTGKNQEMKLFDEFVSGAMKTTNTTIRAKRIMTPRVPRVLPPQVSAEKKKLDKKRKNEEEDEQPPTLTQKSPGHARNRPPRNATKVMNPEWII